MAVYELDGVVPQIAKSAWVADDAVVIGNVIIGEHASIWPGAVLRGDQPEPISVGARSNVQDGCVLHSDAGKPLTIGERVTVGHKVVLHGCTIGDGSLIGIGAIVLNGAKIGAQSLVGAGSLVTEGKVFPEGSLIVGSPATVKRELGPEQLAGLQASSQVYVQNGERFRTGLKRMA